MFLINPYIISSSNYLLDLYPAEVAYSLRKLSSTATKAIRVRRSSDNTEQDIGFVGNDLDTASLLSFCGAGNGFVVKLYNQGVGTIPQPTANWNATILSASEQWQIVSSGLLLVDGGKPCFQYNNSNQTWYTIDNSLSVPMVTQFSVDKNNSVVVINYLTGSAGSGTYTNGTFGGVNGIGAFDGTNIRTKIGADTNRHLDYWNLRSSKLYVSRDGASETDTGAFAATLGITNIGGRVGSATSFNGNIQEVVIFFTDQSANKLAIENNINDYYAIY